MDSATFAAPHFEFDNSFARELNGFFVPVTAAKATSPRLLLLNRALADELGLSAAAFVSELGTSILAGNVVPEGATPLAQAYAGHQFGSFSPQLGDGRALLLGEVIDRNGRRRDIQLKGSGRTPFSRNGDGKAAVGPMVREYLIGEAMHALGIPTTRALSVVSTGEVVHRETSLPGAVLTRVAASHLRVGTFEFFAAQGDVDKVRRLADYAIARHYPYLQGASDCYLSFFRAVLDAQASLVARWMNVAFIHGVMNTDNVTISGETIDYGPCAFMDAYSPDTAFSSIDLHGRYAYANQPPIAHWNLARLAETLVLIVDEDAERAVSLLTEALQTFPSIYQNYWLAEMRQKVGLTIEDDGDHALIKDLFAVMKAGGADFTLVFRRLSHAAVGDDAPIRRLFPEPAALDIWLDRWRLRASQEPVTTDQRRLAMDQINPIYIPRNHKVEEALAAIVDREDISVLSKMLKAVTNPFEEMDDMGEFSEPGEVGPVPYQTFCGT